MNESASRGGGIQVLRRMDQLLEVLANNEQPVSLSRLAEATGLHPSTVHRILASLQGPGYVQRTGTGRYRLGGRVLELAAGIGPQLDVRRESLPVMEKLRNRLGETVVLAVREQDEAVCVERVPGNHSLRVEVAPGTRGALHLTAAGKVLLADAGLEACSEYAHRIRLAGGTPHAIRDLPRLHREVERVQRTGYAMDSEENEVGVVCIATPVRQGGGRVLAVLGVCSPASRHRDTWIPHLLEAGRRISRQLGWKVK